jgi:transposase
MAKVSGPTSSGSLCRRCLREGDIVIMDNLGSHKGKAVRELIRSAGAKLFLLPKYSPDLNPIELASPRAGSHTSSACPRGPLVATFFFVGES